MSNAKLNSNQVVFHVYSLTQTRSYKDWSRIELLYSLAVNNKFGVLPLDQISRFNTERKVFLVADNGFSLEYRVSRLNRYLSSIGVLPGNAAYLRKVNFFFKFIWPRLKTK